MKFSKILVCCSLPFTLSLSFRGQTNSSQEPSESVRGFVQQFYNWYVPKTRADNSGPAWEIALKNKGSVFAAELARALKQDSEAQAKAEGVIVGLDFDPFLSTQDPCARYEAGRVAPKGMTYWVDIHRVCSGKRSEKPDVVAELIQQGDHWLFVNFHYPKGRNLLATLKLLKESREKPDK